MWGNQQQQPMQQQQVRNWLIGWLDGQLEKVRFPILWKLVCAIKTNTIILCDKSVAWE